MNPRSIPDTLSRARPQSKWILLLGKLRVGFLSGCSVAPAEQQGLCLGAPAVIAWGGKSDHGWRSTPGGPLIGWQSPRASHSIATLGN